MSAPVNANINVIVNTSQAVAQLRSLQAQVAATNKGLAASSGAAVAQQAALNKALMDGANASRMWNARIVPMITATERFSQSIDKGKLSLGQYSRYAASQLPGMSRVFKREFDMMSRVAEQNVRRMQTQYVSLGTSATGAAQAMALTPTHLNKMAAASAIATQRQVLMNRMIDLGSTKLLNWGKNTQWAGRQLMVGFSLPLAMLGTVAAKTFKEIDQSAISFKRVYGDLRTTTAEMERNLEAVKELGMEYTKYGKSLSSTIELAAKVAATGAQGESLTAATEQTIRLATLGLMEYDEALGATIALQTAFGVSNEDLASTIDFLNVTENETILTMQDMAAAIPRVAPVVKGLGGDIKDLAVMMTAMREGGVTAEQGANAIKSGLARLINPTKAAKEQMQKFGISIDAIVQKNRGDLMGTIQDFGQALATLDEFEQQQSLEKVFGKYQYARLGALFKNITRDGSQAQRTIDLTAMSVEDLASISDRELSKIEEATSTRFAAAMERLKVSIAPIGETFMKAIMPIIDFVAKIANSFNDLPDGIKSAIAIAVGAIAGLGPIVLMTVGLIANGIANIVKLTQTMRKFFARLRGDTSAFQHLTAEEHEARGAADALSGSTERLTNKFLGQRKALESLTAMLGNYSRALSSTAMASPMMMGVPTAQKGAAPAAAAGGRKPFYIPAKFADGGLVPGTGNKDTVPALLTPGESVITKDATKKYSSIIASMNAGTIQGFNNGSDYVRPLGNISGSGGPTSYMNPGGLMLPGNQTPFGMDRSMLTGTSTSGASLSKSILGGMVASAQIVEKEFGSLAPNARATAGYFREMEAVIGPTSKAIAEEIRQVHFEMEQAGQSVGSIDDVIKQAQPKIQQRLVALSQTGPMGATAAEGASRFLFNNASEEDLGRLGEKRTAGVLRKPDGSQTYKPYRLRESVLQSPTESYTRMAYGGRQSMPSGMQFSHMLGGRFNAPASPMVGGMMEPGVSPAIRQQMLGGLIGYGRSNPMYNMNSDVEASMRRDVEAANRAGRETERVAARTARNIPPAVKTALGENSPSKIAQTFGVDWNRGLAIGLESSSSLPVSEAKEAANRVSMASREMLAADKAAQQTSGYGAQRYGTGAASREPLKISYSDQVAGVLAKSGTDKLMANNLRGISKEVGNIFRLLPQTAQEIARNFKESGKIIGSIISQIAGPYVKPIVDAFNVIKTNVYVAKEIIVANIKKIPVILKGAVDTFTAKVKGSYEMLALRTSIAMDSIKGLPAKVKSAYETAAIKTMIALDSIKKLPETMKRKALELQNSFNNFKANLPQNLMRARNQAFYRGQDLLGRGREALSGIGRRFAGMRERFSASNAYAGASLREGSLRSAARAYVPDAAAAQVKTMTEQINKAVSGIRTNLTATAEKIAVSARAAAAALREGDLKTAIRAMTPDKVAQAFSAAVKPISNAAKFAYGKMVDGARFIGGKLSEAAGVVGRKFSEVAGKITSAGQNLANSLNVAGRAIAAGDLKTALRSLTPDRVAAAMGSARARAGEMYGTAKQKVGAIASQARATGITAYNALLARDVKTFIKALTPDRVWEAGRKLATSISGTAQRVATAGKLAYDTIMFNAKAAIVLGPGIIKDGFNLVRSSLIQGSKFIKDTIAVNVRAALVVGAAEIKKAFTTATSFITKGGKLIFDSVKLNIGAAIYIARDEIRRIGTILKTEGPKLKESLRGAVTGIASTLKTAGVQLADSIRSIGGMVRSAGAAAAQGVRGFLQGGVNERTGQNRGQRIAGSGNTAMMGLMGLSMAASMTDGALGEMAQKIMPVTMGLMGLQMMLPMLTNPIGLAILATTALVGGFIYLRKQLDDTAKEAAKMGANIGGVANGMKVIEEATGFKPAKYEDRLFRFSKEDREAMAEFSSYFESEAGSKFIEELKGATSEERYQKVSALLAQAVASGLEEDKAKSFGMAIAEATGDALLNSSIARDFANQVFGQGSQALIDLEKERFGLAPQLPKEVDYSNLGGLMGGMSSISAPESVAEATAQGAIVGTQIAAAALAVAAGAAIASAGPQAVVTAPVAAGALAFAGIAAAIGAIQQYVVATDRQKETTAEAARGLGFYLQTVQNLANAESVLEEERRKGLISFPEYENRLDELEKLQENASTYIGEIFSVGADAGAMAQALGDQLSFAGFSEDQIKRVTERFSPDSLAKEFFGEGQTFETLGTEQKNYVEQALTKVLSGLSPENVEQRLADIEGTYKDMAEKVVNAMINGSQESIDFFFNKQNISDYISQRMGGSFYSDLNTQVTPDQMAQNLLGQDMPLKEMGTDALEVFTRLGEFTDQTFAKSLMSTEKGILSVGDAVSKLAEYKDINIELVLKKNIDPKDILLTIDKINKIKIDKKVFGNAMLDAEQLTNSLLEFSDVLGISLSEIPGLVADSVDVSTKRISGLAEEAFNKIGNIKINPEIVTTLFGTDEKTAKSLSDSLKSAFPTGLPPAILPIYLSLMNGEMLVALSKLSPDAKAAIESGATAGTKVTTAGGTQFSSSYTLTELDVLAYNADKAAKSMADQFLPKGGTEAPEDPKGSGSSGGGKKENPLKEIKNSLMERLKIYTNIDSLAKKLKGKKNALEKTMAGLTYEGSFIDSLRKMNLSESLIADLLSKGFKNAQKIVKSLGEKGLQQLNISELVGRSRQTTSDAVAEAGKSSGQVSALSALRSRGVDEETAMFIAEDADKAEELNFHVSQVEKGITGAKKALWEFINAQKAAAQGAKAWEEASKSATEKLEDSLSDAQKVFDQTTNLINQGFDDAEQTKRDQFAASFLDKNGQTVAQMERQVVLNQRLIDQEQDKIDKKQEQINDYQRENDLTQQGIDDLKRQDEMRNRVASALSYDLEQMGLAEQDIRDAYDEKIKSLEKVESINQRIIEQQKGQLSLAQALSEGDIYAATQAAQEMRAADAQFAMQNTRDALQQSMENQIESLTSADGLTREQIEDQIRSIKEQSYQASLMIRVEEDKIYANSLKIRDLATEIYDINENSIEPLQNKNKEFERTLSMHAEEEEYAVKNLVLAGMTREEWNKKADALQRNIDNASELDPWLRTLVGDYVALEAAARAAADQAARLGGNLSAQTGIANMPDYIASATSSPTGANAVGGVDYSNMDFSGIDFSGMNFGSLDFSGLSLGFGSGGMVKYAKGGMVNPLQYTSNEKPPTQMASGGVAGNGSRDSIPAMLTPGEFIIRKAMVDKYGIPMLSALNQGAFSMPRFNTSSGPEAKVSGAAQNSANIVAPMYNNYSVNVSVSGSNSTADEIANKTIMKIKQMQETKIRSGRGY
jgi:TP901 family phage tail tape measure protein